MNFEKLNSLIGVKTPTSEALGKANAELTLAGIDSVRLVSEEALAEARNETAANASLNADLETANANLVTAQEALATAQENLNLANSENAELRSRLDALGQNPGATHSTSTGADANADTDEVEAIMANLPHNKKADQLFN